MEITTDMVLDIKSDSCKEDTIRRQISGTQCGRPFQQSSSAQSDDDDADEPPASCPSPKPHTV